ncbi:LOW QUALITY PROTEIN: hypothetical protein Q4I29_006923 [Leishmania shawi]|uniref:Ig-like domain-containing protein n=1 Tax=Leishmania shawi TaxID=5680 RepID=A0ABR3E042_9TRYP
MTKLPRSRGPSCDAESISSSITGCCPPAPTPFRYLTASSEVTRYQQPSFRSMELLLPASLWSDSFVQERARYTLLPRHLSQFSSPSASATLMPSSSSARDSTPSTTAALVTTQEEQRRTSSADVDNCLSGCAPGRWSFMTIYRNFKRAREEAATWVKTPEMSRRDCLADNAPEGDFFSERPYRPSAPPILSLSSPSMSPVDGCSTTEVDDGDNYGEEVIVQSRGLSSSCPSSSTTSRAESMGAAAWYSAAAAVASEVNIQSTMLHGYQVTQSSFPATAGVAATSLTAEYAEAFRLLEIVLDQVSTAHATHCPLCSPPRPPRWGRGAQLALPPTARTPDAIPPPSTPISHVPWLVICGVRTSSLQMWKGRQRWESSASAAARLFPAEPPRRSSSLPERDQTRALQGSRGVSSSGARLCRAGWTPTAACALGNSVRARPPLLTAAATVASRVRKERVGRRGAHVHHLPPSHSSVKLTSPFLFFLEHKNTHQRH